MLHLFPRPQTPHYPTSLVTASSVYHSIPSEGLRLAWLAPYPLNCALQCCFACLPRYVFQDLGGRLLQGPLAQKAGSNALGFLQKSITDAKASGLLTQVGCAGVHAGRGASSALPARKWVALGIPAGDSARACVVVQARLQTLLKQCTLIEMQAMWCRQGTLLKQCTPIEMRAMWCRQGTLLKQCTPIERCKHCGADRGGCLRGSGVLWGTLRVCYLGVVNRS